VRPRSARPLTRLLAPPAGQAERPLKPCRSARTRAFCLTVPSPSVTLSNEMASSRLWSGPPALVQTGAMIRLGTPADLPAAADVYRRASLSNAGDRDNLMAHPEYLILRPEGLAEGRTYVAEEDGSVVGFATWAEAGGTIELEDLFVDPGWRRRGIATALVSHIVDVLRARSVQCLEVTANPHAQGFYIAAGFIDCGVANTDFGTAPHKRLAIR